MGLAHRTSQDGGNYPGRAEPAFWRSILLGRTNVPWVLPRLLLYFLYASSARLNGVLADVSGAQQNLTVHFYQIHSGELEPPNFLCGRVIHFKVPLRTRVSTEAQTQALVQYIAKS